MCMPSTVVDGKNYSNHFSLCCLVGSYNGEKRSNLSTYVRTS